MYLLGYDIGSSSVKAALVRIADGKTVASAFSPSNEMEIISVKAGWAEQHTDTWWEHLRRATHDTLAQAGARPQDVKAIGISYQMHGLVVVDETLRPLRNAIIWCDSRAVPYGTAAYEKLGGKRCLTHLLNSPANFTLSKLAWVKENEPQIFARTFCYMLPGDYIAARICGKPSTTLSGLSEGIGWNFTDNAPARFLYDYFGFDTALIPEIVPTFGMQGYVTAAAAAELGLAAETPVTYRAGDQPNNAFSLNVMSPGEVAATAGTSGVVYGILGEISHDPQSRINSFAHVNHTQAQPRIGMLLCVNGTAILNAWIRNNIAPEGITYAAMNELAATVPIGSDGVSVIPFGNGAERMLCNQELNCSIHGINFVRHGQRHIIRAAQEGIAFSLKYGMDIMNNIGMNTKTIRAGHANMFLSRIFGQTLANVSGATIELYNTDGATGAARGAGLGAGLYRSEEEAFASLQKMGTIVPCSRDIAASVAAYERWKEKLDIRMSASGTQMSDSSVQSYEKAVQMYERAVESYVSGIQCIQTK